MREKTQVSNDGYAFWLPTRLKAGTRHVCVMDGDKILKFRKTTKERAGGNGFGMSTEDVSYTITVRDRHGVGVFR